MLSMLNLIRNENMKIFMRISAWVMLGLLLLFVVAYSLILKFVEPDIGSKSDWRAELTQQNEMFRKNLQQPGMPKAAKDEFMKQLKLNEYSLQHDVPPIKGKSLWGFTNGSKDLISIISLFTIIIGAGAVASEFSTGTIKLLLIRPVMRWKILLSKYISTLSSALAMLVILFVFSFLLGGIMFGFRGASQPYLAYTNGTVMETNMVLHVFAQYGLACVDMLMLVTLAFMISTVFRNSALAIGLGVFLMFTGNIVVSIFSRYGWVKYILFANMNLSQYFDGVPIVEGMTLGFSVIVLLVYFAIFNLISWVTFIKRDVAA